MPPPTRSSDDARPARRFPGARWIVLPDDADTGTGGRGRRGGVGAVVAALVVAIAAAAAAAGGAAAGGAVHESREALQRRLHTEPLLLPPAGGALRARVRACTTRNRKADRR